ncbi:hypothetical protein G6F57_007900 [Rhizopus arrhizus]|uniref:Alpha/beta hydrolase fold-3 domain-containing protein n=1 Tax=Rhizopus oryzae TaxID=64495 RepID=A0A9P6XE38_RHIOR|nr:hypothetical protein G6F23_002932 [Rhizopus arrhizus]KAG1415983.1 hypothetical protein G6F58_006201 [Rhizopus delemar]KAG0761279.1 hypothetical protein G6F24_007690 [Rhizopus arrhizus]KAG0787687.1 hypothetical protein G6F21_007737 [Rhizopus arrhizus]KAG0799555.1 hypothetical protein G6F22_003110 [Rhizopus arrhizus]
MHPSFARNIVHEFTQPLKDQKRFIRKFDNEHWKGSLIMSEMIRCDDETAIKRLQKSDVVIFEIHGGGFRTGHSTMYMDSFINWLRLFKNKHNLYACIMSVEYGLAPKHKYPGPLNECIAAYNYLTQHLGVSPSKVIFSGDSAGGALAIETLIRTYAPQMIHDLDAPRTNFEIPLPAAILLSSPLVSPERDRDSWKKYEKQDLVSSALYELVFKEYLGLPETKPEDLPILRMYKILHDFDRFLPKHVLTFVGKREVLRDGAVELCEAIKTDGKIEVSLIEEDFVHDWFMIHHVIGKSKMGMIHRYDELFVDFAVKAVQESNPASFVKASSKAERVEELEVNEDVDVVQEKVILDEIQKSDENVEVPTSSVIKSSTILSEYAVIVDEPRMDVQ